MPDDSSLKPLFLKELGDLIVDKFTADGDKRHLVTACEHFIAARDHPQASIAAQFRAGQALFHVFSRAKLWSVADRMHVGVVALIPHLAPRTLADTDKQHFMTQVAGFASDAASVTLRAGRSAYDSISVLESGRGIMIHSLNEMRADLTELQEKHPRLAGELQSLLRQIGVRNPLYENCISAQYTAAEKIQLSIYQIRKQEGFERFLMPPLEQDLMAAAKGGPIVVVNTSECGCDALIIEECRVRSLPLPLLQMNDIAARAGHRNEMHEDTLEWLWDIVAEPVLRALGFTDAPKDGKWPRLWWIPTGILATLPLHAAGYHWLAGSSNLTVLDRVISSYSPSVAALIQSLHQRIKAATTVSQGPSKVVLVGMNDPPYARQEVDELTSVCEAMRGLRVSRPQALRHEVLSELKNCSIFHFAGHGRTDLSSPVNSSLDLNGELLTVQDLFELNLQQRAPYLAYLSACGTGQVINDRLVDESLHLIGACQLAGFQNVVGTLWEVNDVSCKEVAVRIYKWLGHHGMSDGSVSEGLHHVVRHMRDEWALENGVARLSVEADAVVRSNNDQQLGVYRDGCRSKTSTHRDIEPVDHDAPLHWVPYVHFGV